MPTQCFETAVPKGVLQKQQFFKKKVLVCCYSKTLQVALQPAGANKGCRLTCFPKCEKLLWFTAIASEQLAWAMATALSITFFHLLQRQIIISCSHKQAAGRGALQSSLYWDTCRGTEELWRHSAALALEIFPSGLDSAGHPNSSKITRLSV